MQIYNTLTRKKEELKPIKDGKIGIYVCGPTVYNYIHIGNARPLCVFDVLVRFLRYRGVDVTYVSNYTDVNDKIIKQAEKEGSTPEKIAEKYIAEFEKDSNGLNVTAPDVRPRVSKYIGKIIGMIKTLVDNGYAYESGGDVYYRTRKFESYGKLSRQPLDELIAGARVEINDLKEDPLDFALWKRADESEQHWNSPWGPGRPGWHIECSAMAKDTLGDTIDIHGGGCDLIFPHHENEIAQSEAATGKEFAHYWMHNGHINIDNKKMSKSAGNFFLTRDAAEKYGYETVRYLMIQAHYRMPMNYTPELLLSCKSSLDRLYNLKSALEMAISNSAGEEISENVSKLCREKKDKFINSLEDDLNTADALSAIFELTRDVNTLIFDGISKAEAKLCLDTLVELCGVLGILSGRDEEIPDEITELVNARKQARAKKDFALADSIRDEIESKGYAVEETRQGTKVYKKH